MFRQFSVHVCRCGPMNYSKTIVGNGVGVSHFGTLSNISGLFFKFVYSSYFLSSNSDLHTREKGDSHLL